MSIETVLADVGGDVKKFISGVAADFRKVKAVWDIISSPQTRALAVTITAAVLQEVKDVELAVGANGFNITLDTQVYTDAKALWADIEAGDGVIKSDLHILGLI